MTPHTPFTTKAQRAVVAAPLLALLLVGLAFLLTPSNARAADITVNTTADENGTGADCSLREAVTAANTNTAFGGCAAGSGADTILFNSPNLTYTLTITNNADGPTALTITSTIVISGNGSVISKNAASNFRLFHVGSGGNLTLQDVTLRNGRIVGFSGGGGSGGGGGSAGLGGAIYNRGTLILDRVTLTDNRAVGGNGGPDSVGGNAGGGGGGGMQANGANNSTTSGGAGGGPNGGSGGASCTAATGDGGGGGGGGDTTRPGCAGGFGGGGGGGARNASNEGAGGNGGFGGGGGGGSRGSAAGGSSSFGGGTGGVGTSSNGGGGGGGLGAGGAVFNHSGTVAITNTTFYSNSVAGGTGGAGGNAGAAGQALGGGLFNHDGIVRVNNATFSDNTANNGGTDIFSRKESAATLVLRNTILANGGGGVNNCRISNASGSTTTTGSTNNLIENNGLDPCPSVTVTADPQLGALANNGGKTQTMAIPTTSPAKNAGDNATCAATDQRGVSRPQEGACDIGAYEFQPAVGSIMVKKVSVGGDGAFGFSSSFTTTNPFTLTTVGGVISKTFANVTPGSGYTVTEKTPVGWQLTGSSCDNGTPGNITVAAGLTTTCTFTNTKLGAVTVVKKTVGGDGAFGFTGNVTTTTPFTVSTSGGSGSATFANVTPGSGYTVTEKTPVGWQLTGSSCDNGTPGNITVAPGLTTTCTFTNTVASCFATPDNGATVFSTVDAHAVQQAVDASSPGGTVKVAGTCVGVESRAGTNQSTYISKTLTLSGGYTLTNWTTSDPVANPTTIDANGGGRALRIEDTNTGDGLFPVRVENLRLVRGTFNGDGGGVRILNANVTLSSTIVLSSTATSNNGGGVSMDGPSSPANTLFVLGGRIENNRCTAAGCDGGGLYVVRNLVITDTQVISNSAMDQGGGLRAFNGPALYGGLYERNVAGAAGGVWLSRPPLIISGTHFISNTTSGTGGGLRLNNDANFDPGTVVNAYFRGNRGVGGGSAGGAIFTTRPLIVINSQFISNTARTGGAIGFASASNPGGQIRDSLFERNTANASNNAGGGAIAIRGPLVISGVTFLTNTVVMNTFSAAAGGGAVNSTRALTISNSTFLGNRCLNAGCLGGALLISGTQTTRVTDSRLLSNTAGGDGGAIYQHVGTTIVANSCIVNNSDTAVRYAGGTSPLTAVGNWWGAANGPSGAGFGNGDSVSANVNFAGFLAAPILGCPNPPADLAISKTVTPTTATPGATITYTLRFTNPGPNAASGVVVYDSLPISVSLVSIASSGAAITQTSGAPNLAWHVAPLAPGAGGVITITALISANDALVGTTIINTVVITASNDITPTNNSGAAGVTVIGLSGTIIVQKVVVGKPPASAWQFNGPTGAFTLPAVGGSAVFTPVAAGSYTISETPQQYYAAVSACSNGATGGASVNVTMGSAQTITCTFTNTRTIGLITIIKDSTPKSTQNFNFSAGPPTPLIGVGNEGGVLSAFMLDDAVPDDKDLYPKQRSFLLPNGTYNFGETPPSNWHLKAIECTASDGSSFVVTLPGVAITLGGGDVTCTFKNEMSVTIQTLKYQDTNGNGVRNTGEPVLANWTITATLQPTGTALPPQVTNSLGRANFNFIPAGTYKVCEVLKPGWVNTQPGGASPCHTLTLAPGQTASVNFGNRAAALSSAGENQELTPLSPYAGVTIVDGDPDAFDGYTVDWAAWVDATLLTPVEEPADGPGVEPGEADLTPRIYLPVVVR